MQSDVLNSIDTITYKPSLCFGLKEVGSINYHRK